MEYRGKHYSVVQGLDGSWKWSVKVGDRTKSGNAPKKGQVASELKRGERAHHVHFASKKTPPPWTGLSRQEATWE